MPPAGAEPALLELAHLVKEFPLRSAGVFRHAAASVKAVSDVSFEVARGETVGLVGESGSGKTTLARMVVALDTPTSGEVRLEGRALASLSARELRRARRLMQMVFQDPYSSLDPRMRAGSIIREPLRIQRVGSAGEQASRVRELLDEVGLGAGAAERFPHELSGGQRQRLALARALALTPELVVADEPVSALDVSIRAQILNLMNELRRTHGLTYLLISHDLSVVRYVADRIGVMYLGKLVEMGPARSVHEQPAHPYTAGLLEAIPTPDPVAERAKAVAPPSGEMPSAVDPPSGCRYRTRCERAQELCAQTEPPLRPFGPGHSAACHFPLRQAAVSATTG